MTDRGVIDLNRFPDSRQPRRPMGSGEPVMYEGKLVFAQLMDHLPMHTFRRCVARFKGDHSVKSFTCQDQLLPARTVADLYKCRWQIELFFKWIKRSGAIGRQP